ncbi:hypothetical protein JD844_002556 [Phrynosoma platyrhinos]|uniref:Uncharacterized protein n=1 Tax=Phrynosoma platyrhinos TaxID=52577 RepID=A0ABQ7TBV4_PHRPL|nr:hypothetical protein JD844_002556 [Phrynosoma platyrhinos]
MLTLVYEYAICDFTEEEKANYLLEEKVVDFSSLKEQVDNLKSQLHGLRSDMKDITHRAVSDVLEGYTSKGITKWSIEKMLKKLMEKLDEDYVQMPDYALRSAGISGSGCYTFGSSFDILEIVALKT